MARAVTSEDETGVDLSFCLMGLTECNLLKRLEPKQEIDAQGILDQSHPPLPLPPLSTGNMGASQELVKTDTQGSTHRATLGSYHSRKAKQNEIKKKGQRIHPPTENIPEE